MEVAVRCRTMPYGGVTGTSGLALTNDCCSTTGPCYCFCGMVPRTHTNGQRLQEGIADAWKDDPDLCRQIPGPDPEMRIRVYPCSGTELWSAEYYIWCCHRSTWRHLKLVSDDARASLEEPAGYPYQCTPQRLTRVWYDAPRVVVWYRSDPS